MPGYLPFKEIAESVDVEQVAKHVGLALKRNQKDMRAKCPTCKTDDERSLAIFPETNSFRCFASNLSGDCIALYGHLTGTAMYASAKYLQEQFATPTGAQPTAPATSPQKPGGRSNPSPPASTAAPSAPKKGPGEFDPDAFAAKLAYGPEVEAIGLSEEDAARLGIGSYRNKVWLPMRDLSGQVLGFIGYAEGEPLKMPPKWLPSKIVQLKRPA